MNAIKNFLVLYNGLFIYIFYSLLIIAFTWVLSYILSKKMFSAVKKSLDKKERRGAFQIFFEGFTLPVSVFIKLAGISISLIIFSAWGKSGILGAAWTMFFTKLPSTLGRFLRILAIIAIAWGFVRSSEISTIFIKNANDKLDLNVSKSVRQFMSAIYNVLIIAIAAVAIFNEMNIDINGLIAGLGLGGLTIALAAKDSAANFFGGLVIVTEKPFEIGDWIECDNVIGGVEDISLRSTKIRTTNGSLTIVPNSILSSSSITNWTKTMQRRKANFKLLLCLDTPPEKIRLFSEKIEQMLLNDEEVLDEGIVVRFTALADSGYEITVIFNTSIPAYAEHLRIKERINYGITEIAASIPVEFAYPSQTVYLSK